MRVCVRARVWMRSLCDPKCSGKILARACAVDLIRRVVPYSRGDVLILAVHEVGGRVLAPHPAYSVVRRPLAKGARRVGPVAARFVVDFPVALREGLRVSATPTRTTTRAAAPRRRCEARRTGAADAAHRQHPQAPTLW